jgi:hypothetical protein
MAIGSRLLRRSTWLVQYYESQRSRPECREAAPARLGSQGQCLAENLVAEAVLEHVGGCDVHGQTEDLSSLAAKRSQVEEGAAWLEVYEEIHVAFGRSFAPRERPEGTQMTDPVSLGGV